MTLTLEIPVVILAGGRSSRFGGDKATAKLAGIPLFEHVIHALRPQTSGPIVLNTNVPEHFDILDVQCVGDAEFGDQGPLTGIYTALDWARAQHFSDVATVAVDTPFLPDNLLHKLKQDTEPAIASSVGKLHPICGHWPVGLLPLLTEFLISGSRAAKAWSEHCGACEVPFEVAGRSDPFFNINTRADLLEAERLISV